MMVSRESCSGKSYGSFYLADGSTSETAMAEEKVEIVEMSAASEELRRNVSKARLDELPYSNPLGH